MNSAMIDIETLSTRHDAAVVSIGVAIFNEAGLVHTDGWALSPKEIQGHIDPATIGWWMKQSDEARKATFEGTENAFGAAFKLKATLAQFNAEEVWANDPTFDIVILKNWWERLNSHGLKVGDFPINFRAERSFRTIVAESKRLGFDPWLNSGMYVAHNAIDDAAAQARVVVAARKFFTDRS